MRIWTIQTQAAWESLQSHGVLQAAKEHQDESWPDAYAWITQQLIRRVGPPPDGDCVPLWGWYQCHSASKPRPDLRIFRHNYPPGQYVLIELELPEPALMLSDFDAWHIALNGHYLPLSEDELAAYQADRERYEADPNEALAEDLRRRYYASWERIIDMHLLTEPDWAAPENRSIQACFWLATLENVKSAKRFSGLGR